MTIYIDTNIFIYLFEKHPNLGEKVAGKLSNWQRDGRHQFITSTLTVAECLAQVTDITLETFESMPGLTLVALDGVAAEQAGILQRQGAIGIGDAIHLATALVHGAGKFYTNDKKLAKTVAQQIQVEDL